MDAVFAADAVGAGRGRRRPDVRRATVVGCGNWLMREDRVGPKVLRALRGRLGPGVDLEVVGTTVLGLLDLLDGQDLLVLVDACLGRGAPGEVLRVEPDPAAPLPERIGTHQIGPVETLAIARELTPDRMPRRTVMVLVSTSGLSEAEETEAAARAAAEVIEVVRSWRADGQAACAPSGAT